MPKAYDYLLDDSGDLLFKDGDLVVGESDHQHIQDTINAEPGWWKEFPTDGVGIRKYLGSNDRQQDIQKQIKVQLQVDGYAFVRPPLVKYDGKNLRIDANAYRP